MCRQETRTKITLCLVALIISVIMLVTAFYIKQAITTAKQSPISASLVTEDTEVDAVRAAATTTASNTDADAYAPTVSATPAAPAAPEPGTHVHVAAVEDKDNAYGRSVTIIFAVSCIVILIGWSLYQVQATRHRLDEMAAEP